MRTWLKWEENRDEHGNTYWESTVLSTWGVHCYRICQKLINNKIKFIESSDDKLLLDSRYIDFREEWTNIGDAMYDMERHYQEFLKQYDTTRSI
jgi:hypothetical protein